MNDSPGTPLASAAGPAQHLPATTVHPTPPSLSLPAPSRPAARAVYSLVKFAGASNYIAATWTPEDLAACADLNLPCADVSGMLLRPVGTGVVQVDVGKAGMAASFAVHVTLLWCMTRPPPLEALVLALLTGSTQ